MRRRAQPPSVGSIVCQLSAKRGKRGSVAHFFQLERWHLNLKPISKAFWFLFFIDKVMYPHDINCFIVLFLFRQITSILKLFTAPRHLARLLYYTGFAACWCAWQPVVRVICCRLIRIGLWHEIGQQTCYKIVPPHLGFVARISIWHQILGVQIEPVTKFVIDI